MNVDCWLRDCHLYLFLIKLRGEKFTQIIHNEAEYSFSAGFIIKINVSKSMVD